MKLITLGCSLTQICGIPQSLSHALNLECKDLSESAGSNLLQSRRLMDSVAQASVSRDDMVIWQITGDARPYERLPDERLTEAEELAQQMQSGHYHHVLSDPNMFSARPRVDLLSNSELLSHTHSVADDLQSVVATMILANSYFRHMWVYLGWSHAVQPRYRTTFRDCLARHQIEFIDAPFLDWAVQNHKAMGVDNAHPHPATGKEFAETVILPSILQALDGSVSL